MANTIPEELVDWKTLVEAAETDDEIGTVLRLHLVIEKLLAFYLDRKRVGDLAKYTQQPRSFAGKLSLSAAFGLPIPLVGAAYQINKIRNKLAHKDQNSINPGDIKELARRVERISELGIKIVPLEKQAVSMPLKRPDETIAFGKDSPRIDFFIATMIFYSATIQWLNSVGLMEALESSG